MDQVKIQSIILQAVAALDWLEAAARLDHVDIALSTAVKLKKDLYWLYRELDEAKE